MIHFDRRAWLGSFSLAVGCFGASRLLGAPQSSRESIGLPDENAIARPAVRKSLLKSPA
jgi:hypothetical protein